jgi:hypothetical protein
MPTPEPRPEFVDRALAKATGRDTLSTSSRLRRLITAWELWIGVGLGGVVAAALTIFMLRTGTLPSAQDHIVSLALNETREIDVVIDSERDLEGATIRVAVSGGIALDGFENQREIDWQTDLERGTNLLSLPVVALGTGDGRLVAIIEHEGKRRTVAIDLTVTADKASQS